MQLASFVSRSPNSCYVVRNNEYDQAPACGLSGRPPLTAFVSEIPNRTRHVREGFESLRFEMIFSVCLSRPFLRKKTLNVMEIMKQLWENGGNCINHVLTVVVVICLERLKASRKRKSRCRSLSGGAEGRVTACVAINMQLGPLQDNVGEKEINKRINIRLCECEN